LDPDASRIGPPALSGHRRTPRPGRTFRVVGASVAATVVLGAAGVALGPAFRTPRSTGHLQTLAAPLRLAGTAAQLPAPEQTAAPHASATPGPPVTAAPRATP